MDAALQYSKQPKIVRRNYDESTVKYLICRNESECIGAANAGDHKNFFQGGLPCSSLKVFASSESIMQAFWVGFIKPPPLSKLWFCFQQRLTIWFDTFECDPICGLVF